MRTNRPSESKQNQTQGVLFAKSTDRPWSESQGGLFAKPTLQNSDGQWCEPVRSAGLNGG